MLFPTKQTFVALLFLSGCTTTQTLWNQYQLYPHNKAFAVGTNGISGAAWSAASVEQAQHLALSSCATYGGTRCSVIDVNGGPPPTPESPALVQPPPALSVGPQELRVVSSGTGFFVNEEIALTNEHVVNLCDDLTLSRGQENLRAEVLSTDPQNDLAVLRAERTSIGYAVVAQQSTSQGGRVFVYGYPLSGVLSTEPKISEGIINSTSGLANDIRFLQFSAPIQPGNSGAPLIGDDGHVVGIVTSTLNSRWAEEYSGTVPQNVNFAIKSFVITALLDSIDAEYNTSTSNASLNATDVVSRASAYTYGVQCWRR